MKNLDLLESITGLVEVNIQLAKLEIKDTIASIAVKVIKAVALLIFGIFALIFASITLALFLAQVLESNFYGFGIVTLIYVLLLVIVLVMKKQMQKAVEKNVEQSFLPTVKSKHE